MVGYHRHDILTPTQKFVAGVVSGCTTRFITQPIDVIKIRAQLQRTRKGQRSYFKLIKNIIKHDGYKGFFHGHNLGQIHSVIAVSTQFYVYEITTKLSNEHLSFTHYAFRPLAVLFCGLISGCVATTVVCPLEVIRVRQMVAKKQYKGIIPGAIEVYKSGGIAAFYEGLSASLLQVGPATAICFTIFSYTQKWVLHLLENNCEHAKCGNQQGNVHTASSILIASSVGGFAAGFIAKTLTYPMDLAKRRLQISSHQMAAPKNGKKGPKLLKCDNLVDCIKTAYKHDGLPGLFRGYRITIYKGVMTNVVAFTSYEICCYGLREIQTLAPP